MTTVIPKHLQDPDHGLRESSPLMAMYHPGLEHFRIKNTNFSLPVESFGGLSLPLDSQRLIGAPVGFTGELWAGNLCLGSLYLPNLQLEFANSLWTESVFSGQEALQAEHHRACIRNLMYWAVNDSPSAPAEPIGFWELAMIKAIRCIIESVASFVAKHFHTALDHDPNNGWSVTFCKAIPQEWCRETDVDGYFEAVHAMDMAELELNAPALSEQQKSQGWIRTYLSCLNPIQLSEFWHVIFTTDILDSLVPTDACEQGRVRRWPVFSRQQGAPSAFTVQSRETEESDKLISQHWGNSHQIQHPHHYR